MVNYFKKLDQSKFSKEIKAVLKTIKRSQIICLNCGNFNAHRPWQGYGLHLSSCPWNYYQRCGHCGYESNLAKHVFIHGGKLECKCSE